MWEQAASEKMPSPAIAECRRSGPTSDTGQRSIDIKWLDAFETGHAKIDALHRKLIEDCTELLSLADSCAGWSDVVHAAQKLLQSCEAHFRTEESLLSLTGFARCVEHVAAHRRLECTLQTLVGRMERVDGLRGEHRDIARSLGPALIDIIVRLDLDFRSHLLHHQGR